MYLEREIVISIVKYLFRKDLISLTYLTSRFCFEFGLDIFVYVRKRTFGIERGRLKLSILRISPGGAVRKPIKIFSRELSERTNAAMALKVVSMQGIRAFDIWNVDNCVGLHSDIKNLTKKSNRQFRFPFRTALPLNFSSLVYYRVTIKKEHFSDEGI